ncbi:hypothetical protein DFH07DRAFT_784624 [Mycena maculata]|uniref:Uncharacterized protein n=1 Tax=Mycena maculata TaxID=230809 RepID=A0AAD7HFD4_9AGAR|nr:hypothetical protein DFH07DRAFT_784624 [Mycena maculata]
MFDSTWNDRVCGGGIRAACWATVAKWAKVTCGNERGEGHTPWCRCLRVTVIHVQKDENEPSIGANNKVQNRQQMDLVCRITSSLNTAFDLPTSRMPYISTKQIPVYFSSLVLANRALFPMDVRWGPLTCKHSCSFMRIPLAEVQAITLTEEKTPNLFLMDVRMGPATRSQILFLKIPPAEVQATTITKEKTTKRGMSSDITLSANNATLGSPFQLASGSRRAHLSHRYRRSRRFEPYKREYALSQCSPLENMRQSTTILRRRNHGNVDQVVHQWDLSAASPQTQDSVSMSDLTAAVAGVSLAEEIAAALGGVSIATQVSSSHSPQSPGSHSRSDFERDPHAAVALMVSFGSTFALLLFQATEESW